MTPSSYRRSARSIGLGVSRGAEACQGLPRPPRDTGVTARYCFSFLSVASGEMFS